MEQNFCVYCMNSSSNDTCGHCGKIASQYNAAAHHLQPGTILGGKYVVGAVLGEGGFGITYIGRDMNLDMPVAIKEYFPSGVANRNHTTSLEITAPVGDAQAFFEKGKNSFLEEARTLAKFSCERGIVLVRDYFSENNTAYIVMEYLEGIALKDYLEQQGKMTFAQTVSMLAPIMKVLSKVHEQGLIHRDISPSNIMILKDGRVKLLDFGAARQVGGADEKSLSILLKPGFAPEEQYRTKGDQGPWTDVYALSATMYKMMTGLTPVDAMNRVFSDDLQKIPELNPQVTYEQAAVIYKGMAIQQADRFQNMEELYNACVAGGIESPADAITISRKPSASDECGNAMRCRGEDQRQPDRETQNEQEPVPSVDGPAPKGKKPRVAGFIGSIITGLLTLYCILNATSQIIDENSALLSIGLAFLFGTATFFFGKLYYQRICNKQRKPNVVCLVLYILSVVFTLVCAGITYINFMDFWAEEGTGAFCAVLTVLSLVFPAFFSYFFFPRLERRKKSLAIKIHCGILAGAVALFVIGIIFTSLTTITIGNENIKRNATRVRLSLDVVTDHDVAKLKELKNLESLEIFECFLDDEDVKTLGELTQLKELSISYNTDITDISPLAKLTELTYLNISNTKVSDISCISQLVKLEDLNINNTKIVDLSVLKDLVVLDTLKMDSVEGLDVSTIMLPASVRTLYCNGNAIESLDFLLELEDLINIYAANNQISDLTPLAKFSLSYVDFAANQISDLSPLNIATISDLDVSTNAITDISCLRGIPAYQLDLSYNQISDISALADNYKIGMLNLSNNQIADIGALKECFKIYSLDISFNKICDISALATIDEIQILNARGNEITDISPLASCANLIRCGYTIDLRDNRITHIEALSKFTNTTHIYLSNNQIVDVSPLQNCVALEMLKLNHNQITDASVLATLPNLYILELVGNPIASEAGLGLQGHDNSMVGKSILRITYHENIDFEALAKTENLLVSVYNVPPRQRDPLRKLGFLVYENDAQELDEIEGNDDIAEDPSEEESDG